MQEVDPTSEFSGLMSEMEDVPQGRTSPAPKFQLKSISATHENIMNWLILNRGSNLSKCAAQFGITQSWLSTLIHSDAFQGRFKEKQKEVGIYVASSVPEKLSALSDVAIEKLSQELENSDNPKFILDSFDKILHKAGYAPASAKNPNPAGQLNITNATVNVVSSGDLAEARAFMASKGKAFVEGETAQENTKLIEQADNDDNNSPERI